jgi:hypothetical protein
MLKKARKPAKTANKKPKKVVDLSGNFHYSSGLDVDITWGEDEEGIIDAKVVAVDFALLIDSLCQNSQTAWIVDRVLRANKLYNPDIWSVCLQQGYYGQEIGSVMLETTIAKRCEAQVEAVIALRSLRKRLEQLLVYEYGYLLESLKGLSWAKRQVPKENIIFGQTDHYRRLDPDVIEKYKEYPFPRGIVVPDKMQRALFKLQKFRVIDGYHRIAGAFLGNTDETVEVFVGQKG